MKPTKMRNRLIYNATHVVQSKQIGSALSGDLRKRYSRRSVRVTKGDHVSVQRGEFKGVDGKVTTVSPDKRCVTIEGIKKEKTKGDKFDYLIHTTNLLVTSLNTDDKWRMKILRRGKATGKADETAEVEPVPDKKAKPVQTDVAAKDKGKSKKAKPVQTDVAAKDKGKSKKAKPVQTDVAAKDKGKSKKAKPVQTDVAAKDKGKSKKAKPVQTDVAAKDKGKSKKAKPVQTDVAAKDKAAPAKDKAAPAKDKAAPAKDKAAPAKDKAAPAKDKAAPAKDKAAPAKDKGESKEAKE